MKAPIFGSAVLFGIYLLFKVRLGTLRTAARESYLS